MARSETVALPAGTWVQLTNADATEVTWQAQGWNSVYFVATPNATPPASLSGAVKCLPGFGGAGALQATWLGVAAPQRLWDYCPEGGEAMVSHA